MPRSPPAHVPGHHSASLVRVVGTGDRSERPLGRQGGGRTTARATQVGRQRRGVPACSSMAYSTNYRPRLPVLGSPCTPRHATGDAAIAWRVRRSTSVRAQSSSRWRLVHARSCGAVHDPAYRRAPKPPPVRYLFPAQGRVTALPRRTHDIMWRFPGLHPPHWRPAVRAYVGVVLRARHGALAMRHARRRSESAAPAGVAGMRLRAWRWTAHCAPVA